MTTLEFLAHLRSQHVHVWADGGRVRYRADGRDLPTSIREELARRKTEILGILQQQDDGLSAIRRLDASEKAAGVSVSWAQQELWLAQQLEPGSAAYNVPIALHLRGELDAAALERSLAATIARHDILRTTFRQVDGELRQFIGRDDAFSLPVTDVPGATDAVRHSAAMHLARECGRQVFDLAASPPRRIVLCRTGRSSHVLVVNMHHLICDHASLGLFIDEIAGSYNACREGRPLPVPETEIQYADFAVWQRRTITDEALDAQVTYWRAQLDGAPPLLMLPTDRPRPAQRTSSGDTLPVHIPASAVTALRDIASRSRCTLFVVLLAAFQLLLSRYSGQRDVLVATPVSGRRRRDVERLIGPFLNTLVLRSVITDEPFDVLLHRVRTTVIEAFAHQDVPYGAVVGALHPPRTLGYNPVFQVMFTMAPHPGRPPALSGLEVDSSLAPTNASMFDMELQLWEGKTDVTGLLWYSTDLFDAAAMSELLDSLHTLIAGIVRSPGDRVDRLPVLSAERERQVLAMCRGASHESPTEAFTRLFEQRCATHGDRTAAGFGEMRVSYAELNRRANRVAHALVARGVQPEQVVALLGTRSIDYLTAVLGILKAGAAYLPLDPAHPSARLAGIVEQSGASACLVTADTAPVLQRVLRARTAGRQIDVLPVERSIARVSPDADRNLPGRCDVRGMAYVIYTSGSTGVPKGAIVEHRGMLNHLLAKIADLSLTDADVVAQTASQCFDISVWQFLAALLVGGRVEILADDIAHDASALLDAIGTRRITILEVVPSLLGTLLDIATGDAHRLDDVRWVIPTGEALAPDLARRWFDRFPAVPLVNAYGPTECSDDVAHFPMHRALADSALVTPIGRPIRNTQLHVLDAMLQPCPPGVSGELFVGGDGVGRGYLRDPAKTAGSFVPDPFFGEGRRLYKTGDIARYRREGTLEFLGRMDHQVKINGFRIELGDVEAALSGCPEVSACAVKVVQSPAGEPRLAAYVVVCPEDTDTAHLRTWLKRQVPDYMIPAVFITLDRLPLTVNGKIDRSALPDPAAEPDARRHTPPRTDVEAALVRMCREVLSARDPGVEDNFFALGGNSLSAMRLLARVRATFGVTLPLRSAFEATTLADLASLVEAGIGSGRESGDLFERVTRVGALPLSFAQERMWFLDQMQPGGSAYNIPAAVRIHGPLNVAALEQAVATLVERHEALRTAFTTVDGNARAVVGEPGPVSIAFNDLSHVAESAREEHMQRLATAEAAQPFDLARGPMFRVRLIRLSRDEVVVTFVVHHIVCDGWSLGILTRELFTVYEQLAAGNIPHLPPQPFQYVDYAVWQRRWLEGERLQAGVRYWREQLAGAPPLLELPTDRPRASVQAGRGRERHFVFPAALSESARAFAAAEDATTFMLLLAALDVALVRYSGQTDIVVGSPVAGRARVETEEIVGLFVNTLPIRTRLDGNPSFRETLARVKRSALDASAHQDLPFEKLVDELQPRRALSHSPIFQVMFVLQNIERPSLQARDLAIAPVAVHNGTAKFDLTIAMEERDGCLGGTVEFDSDLFEDATIRQWLRHFQQILENGITQPACGICDLPILSDAEYQQQIVEWNSTNRPQPASFCVHDLVSAQAARTPHATAAVCGGRNLTYRELDHRSDAAARALRASGVSDDSPVAVCFDPSLEMLVGILAVLKAGAPYVPLDPAYPAERLAFMIRDAGARLLLTQRRLAGLLPCTGAQETFLEDLTAPNSNQNVLDARTTPDRLAYVIYTSGSTGRPKGVEVTHGAVVNFLQSMLDRPGVNAADTLLAVTTLSFDIAGLELFLPLIAGARVVIATGEDAADPARLQSLITGHEVTVMQATPATWRLLVGASWPGAPGLEVLCGGEALAGSLARELLPRCAELWNMFGPTETTIWSTVHRVRPGDEPVPIGRPIANTDVYVLDEALRPVPTGVSGELYIGGRGLARGYRHRADLTAERFIPHPFSRTPGARVYRTGDLVRYNSRGELLYLGRLDHQVKIRGFRIELGEIQTQLNRHPDIQVSAVVAHEEVPGEKRLVAYFVARPGATVDAAGLRAFLQGTLPGYMVPSLYVKLDTLPLTANGKVDTIALAARSAVSLERSGERVPPTTDAEIVLARVWAEVLGLDGVGVTDNFFEIGGDSILVIRVIARAADAGVHVTPRQVFQHQTIRELAQAAAASPPSTGAAPASPLLADSTRRRVLESEPGAVDVYPLSDSQAGMLFEALYAPESGVFVQQLTFELGGDADVETLLLACDEVVARHPALRTAVRWHAEPEPLQVVFGHAALPVVREDWRTLDADECERRWNALLAADRVLGFDLHTAPLMRLHVIRMPEFCAVLWTFHHLVLDGWSLALVLRDVLTAYAPRVEKRPLAPSTGASFRDYVEWLRRQPFSEAEAYWRRTLDALPPPTRIAGARAKDGGIAFADLELALPARVSSDLSTVARAHRLTLSSIVQAAWAVVIHRYSGEREILHGVTVSGRPPDLPGVESMVGLFINAIPVRAAIPDHGRTVEWIAHLQSAAAEARQYDFAALSRIQQWSSSAPGDALFESLVVFENFPVDQALESEAARAGIRRVRFIEHNGYPLTLVVVPGRQLRFRLTYAASRVDPMIAAGLLECLEVLLGAIARQPDIDIADLPVALPAVAGDAVAAFNAGLDAHR